MIVVPTQSFFPALRHFPIPAIQNAYRGLQKLIDFSRSHVRNFQAKLEQEGDSFAKGTFLRNLVDARDSETGGSKLNFGELVENTIIFLVAGSDTTAVTTAYALWELGRKPHMRRRLIQEIRTAFPDADIMPTYEQASKLVSRLMHLSRP
jgi:cytochrome P450